MPGALHFWSDERVPSLWPLTYTMPPEDLRVGLMTLVQKWRLLWRREPGPLTVNGRLLPDNVLLAALRGLKEGQGLKKEGVRLVARHGSMEAGELEWLDWDGDAALLNAPEDIFGRNGAQIRQDITWLQEAGGELVPETWDSWTEADPHTVVYRPDQVWVHPDAKVRAAVLDASEGPIWIGSGAEIMPGCLVKGPFVLGDHATLKMGAKIYGDTTVGPYCKVGGEVSNSVLHSYSNKGHDGFLGNSVLGRWCNLGADTNNSNLKNNYDKVKIWDIAEGRFRNTGLTFCGLIMGDHAKSGINTMFNTGTVVGVGANVFGGGFVRPFVPCFGWGGTQGMETFRFDKFCETAARVMARRGMELDAEQRQLLQKVFHETAYQRTWE
jgi:UDP-N-acetylglucosamine diphosphorylase/glucosamine-1-phosphate N-acetyltransferase